MYVNRQVDGNLSTMMIDIHTHTLSITDQTEWKKLKKAVECVPGTILSKINLTSEVTKQCKGHQLQLGMSILVTTSSRI